MKPHLLFIPVFFLTLFLFAPEKAFADCDISLSADTDAALHFVSRDIDASPQNVSVTVKWKANQDCFGPVTVVINQGNIFENEPLSGSKTITVQQRDFAQQLKAECLPVEDIRVRQLAQQLTKENARTIGCTTNALVDWPDNQKGPDVRGLVSGDIRKNVASDVTFAVRTGGSASRTGSIRVCSLFEGRNPDYCKDAQGHGAGYLDIAPMARKFGPIGPWESEMDPAYPANSDIKASSIEIILDPAYVEKNEKEQKFTPTINNLNPFDTIRIRATIRSPRMDVHKYLKVKLMTLNKDGKEVILSQNINLRTLWRNQEQLLNPYDPKIKVELDQWFLTQPAEYVFESDPINLAAYTDTLADSVVAGRKIFLRFYRSNLANTVAGDTNIVKVDKELQFASCVQIYGSGEQKIVGIGGNSSNLKSSGLVDIVQKYRKTGFEAIVPFSTYSNLFSYYIDLKAISDEKLASASLHNSASLIQKIWPLMEKNSSCKNGKLYVLIVDEIFTRDSTQPIYGVADAHGHILMGKNPISDTNIVHETGHALALLLDESAKRLKANLSRYTNCSINPEKDFGEYAKKTPAGEYFLGCNALMTLSNKPIYRPSFASIMDPEGIDKFDVISCGYVLKALQGGEAKSHFAECAQLIK